jgi:acyl-CoA thioester hydrolase
MENKLDIASYNHTIDEKVKFHEVDMMGVVNNAVYLNYFEDARVKYLQDIKSKYNLSEIMENDSFFIMAHNEVDYLIPALFDDELIVYTKIEWIKNTSFGFKHIVKNKITNSIIATGGGILVHIKLSTKEKQNLPVSFVSAIQDFEKGVLKKRD